MKYVILPRPPLGAEMSILSVRFLLKTFFGRELIKTKEIAINTETQAF
jgi:hypothetical protein